MKNLFSSKIVIIIFLAALVGLIWYLASYVSNVRKTPTTQDRPAAQDEKSQEIQVSSSAEPVDIVTYSTKTAGGVFRKIEGDTIHIGNAYEEVAFNLSPAVNVQLTTIKERTDPKAVPEVPTSSTIKLSDLRENDQITLTLEKTAEKYMVTSINVTRTTK